MNRKLRVTLFFAIIVVFNMAASFAHPVTPTLFQNLGVGSYMFGVALAAMLAVNFLFSPFWGKINDYISSRYSLLICCVGYAVGQFFFSRSTTEAQIIAARMFAGMFTAGSFVSILTYIVNTTKDNTQRGIYLATSATIQAIGGAFGYLVGGLLGEINVAVAFNTQIVVLAISGVAFFLICENDAKISIKGVKLSRIARESNPFSAFLASRNFMNVSLFILFLVCILQSLGNTAFDQSFNYYIKDQFNFSSGYNGLLKGLMGLITLAVNATVTMWLINKTDVRKSIIWVFVVCSVMMSIAVVSVAPAPFIASNVIYYACAAISLPLLQNILAKSATGKNSNLVMGLYNSMKSLGGIIGALAAGFTYTISPKLPFISALGAFIVACILSALYYKRVKKADTEEQ